MRNDRPSQTKVLHRLNRLTTVLVISFFVVTLLTPTFTIVPIYFAVQATSPASSVEDWVSRFIASYTEHLNKLVGNQESNFSSFSIPIQIQFVKPPYSTPSYSTSTWTNLPSLITIKNQGNFSMLSKISTINPPDDSDKSNTEKKSLAYWAERFWWPPIDAVRIAYLALGILAGLIGVLTLFMSGHRRRELRRLEIYIPESLQ